MSVVGPGFSNNAVYSLVQFICLIHDTFFDWFDLGGNSSLNNMVLKMTFFTHTFIKTTTLCSAKKKNHILHKKKREKKRKTDQRTHNLKWSTSGSQLHSLCWELLFGLRSKRSGVVVCTVAETQCYVSTDLVKTIFCLAIVCIFPGLNQVASGKCGICFSSAHCLNHTLQVRSPPSSKLYFYSSA